MRNDKQLVRIEKSIGGFWHVYNNFDWIAGFETRREAYLYKRYYLSGGRIVPNYFNVK